MFIKKFSILLATLALLGAAFYNGYPLVYSDTGTYIGSGFDGQIPNDRPVVYGLFLWFFSGGGLSLWPTIFVQCLLMAFVLKKTLTLIWPASGSEDRFLWITVLLCLLTPLPWYSGQLMPDIFTPIQILLIVTYLLQPRSTRLQTGWMAALYVFCCVVHFSNLFIGLGTLIGIAIGHRLWAFSVEGLYKKLIIMGLWSMSAFLVLPAINYAVGREWILSKGGYTFLIGRFIDSGLLKQYLDDHCATSNYRLCNYKDSLPVNSRLFHWEADSPLTKEGGWGNKVTEKEYRQIVKGTLTSPKYLVLHLWESVISTPTQLMQNATGSGLDYKWYRSPASPPWQAISKWFPHEHNEYRFSRQCGNLWKQELNFDFFNTLLFWVLSLSLLVLFWQYWQGTAWPDTWTTAMMVMAIGVLANAFITSSLGSICDRFPSRVVWLLPFWAILVLMRRFLPKE
jgi:hypothetical protein